MTKPSSPQESDLPPLRNNHRLAVSLADIAREAGCSRMTVSRVLHNAHHVKKETRERVLQSVRRLGYKPNPMVVALMQQMRSASVRKGTGVLAYLVSGPRRDAWRSHATYSRFFEGASRGADRHGYRLEVFWLNDPGVSQKRLSRILYAQRICGVSSLPWIRRTVISTWNGSGWDFFAVTYNGGATSNNLTFYLGTTSTTATVLGTLTLNEGAVATEAAAPCMWPTETRLTGPSTGPWIISKSTARPTRWPKSI